MGPDGFQNRISLVQSETIGEEAGPPLAGNRKDCLWNTWAMCSLTASHALLGAPPNCFQINTGANRHGQRMCTLSTVSGSPSAFDQSHFHQSWICFYQISREALRFAIPSFLATRRPRPKWSLAWTHIQISWWIDLLTILSTALFGCHQWSLDKLLRLWLPRFDRSLRKF